MDLFDNNLCYCGKVLITSPSLTDSAAVVGGISSWCSRSDARCDGGIAHRMPCRPCVHRQERECGRRETV
eukprot:6176551-Pleurochrysis_carterae.AAC.1